MGLKFFKTLFILVVVTVVIKIIGARMPHKQGPILNNAEGYNEISMLAGEDLLETLAEVKVLKFRGETDKISDKVMKLYGKYIGDFK